MRSALLNLEFCDNEGLCYAPLHHWPTARLSLQKQHLPEDENRPTRSLATTAITNQTHADTVRLPLYGLFLWGCRLSK